METIQFKTIEQCQLGLVARTSMPGTDGQGMDRFPARAARVSFGNDHQERKLAEDKKLIQYLADHEHLTPFEYQHATFMIECPLFIRSQIHRHRTFSFNEISRRYTSDELGFWIPNGWRGQAASNRQASEGFVEHQGAVSEDYVASISKAYVAYESMLEAGVSREMARAVLPQSLLTRFYMGGNLRNWAHFLKLRMDGHAQHEVQVIASRIYGVLDALWPNSIRALMPPKA